MYVNYRYRTYFYVKVLYTAFSLVRSCQTITRNQIVLETTINGWTEDWVIHIRISQMQGIVGALYLRHKFSNLQESLRVYKITYRSQQQLDYVVTCKISMGYFHLWTNSVTTRIFMHSIWIHHFMHVYTQQPNGVSDELVMHSIKMSTVHQRSNRNQAMWLWTYTKLCVVSCPIFVSCYVPVKVVCCPD